ncbi:MAG: alanine--tRNA ligase [Planctomycetes bacterium]|nr:alanine--tRNA ligase [Planctomycetota bacterium]
MRSAADIRKTFLDYFAKHAGHAVVPSSPVVPHDDPTLLFTNAGMNQFKDVFLGRGTRSYVRAVDTQKCIRAGGKHNDLEDVGRDAYHHTFFEMLGNWSFGDYFKKESIEWAWDLLTRVYEIPKERLYATYFGGDTKAGLEPDEEAKALWLKFLPASHVLPGNMKDNFWEMGETGPCGPCSEIHFDRIGGRDAAALVNSGDPDVLEIWNLVFIQFNRESGGKLTPLPAKHVDTGMGLERLVSVLQGKRSNYETDLWTPLFQAIQTATGAKPYGNTLDDPADIAYRVAADHVRCLCSAIADGAAPGSEGRNYVLRRILRRAARMGHQHLGARGPYLHQVVPAVCQSLGEVFPELRQQQKRLTEVIRDEEVAFGKTLERGIELFEAAATVARTKGDVISAEDAFRLHDSMGFPVDLTQVMAQERSLTVDIAGYQKLMERARETSRAGTQDEARITLTPDAIAKLQTLHVAHTDEAPKYLGRPVTSRVAAIWDGRHLQEKLEAGVTAAIIVKRTSFYAESGGQISDTGIIVAEHALGARKTSIEDNDEFTGGVLSAATGGVSHNSDRVNAVEFEVKDVFNEAGYVLHLGHVKHGEIHRGDSVIMDLKRPRRHLIAAHHTSTHLLNWALRETLGDEVQQRGSLVADDRLRFDFSYPRGMTGEEIVRVEKLVREHIARNSVVNAANAPLDQAKNIAGVRAVFGEKYPDPVRVVSIGATVDALLADPANAKWRGCSVEFCGGTHLASCREAHDFAIMGEGALSTGVRRITALAGVAATAAIQATESLRARIEQASTLQGAALAEEVSAIGQLMQSLPLVHSQRPALNTAMDALREKAKSARREGEASSREAAVARMRSLLESHMGGPLVARLDHADPPALLAALDAAKAKAPETATLVASPDAEAGKVSIAARVPASLIAKGLKAGDWVKIAAQACGGSGGGKPDMAQAGGKDASRLGEALDAALAHASKFA